MDDRRARELTRNPGWQLAKSLGPVPGENYSRYEFTGGAGLQGRKKYCGREMRWEVTADSGRISELPR